LIELGDKFNIIRDKLNLLLNYLIIVYAFVIPFQYTLSKELVKIMLIIWILTFDYKNLLYILKTNRLFQLILVFVFLLFLSYLWSGHYPNTVYGDFNLFYKSFTTFFLFPLIIIISKLDEKYLKYVIYSFIISMIINSFISFGIYFEFWDTISGTVRNPIPFQISHISYSVYLALASLITFYKIKDPNKNYIRLLWLAIFIVLFIDLFLTRGRTGQFSFILTFIIIVFIYYKKHVYKLMFFLIAGISVLFILYNSLTTFNSRVNYFINDTKNILNQKKYSTSFGTRLMSFSTIPYLVNSTNILFGEGLGDRESYIKTTLKEKKYPYQIVAFKDFGRLHNMYLEILISNGIVGLCLFLTILLITLFIKFKDEFFKYLSYCISILFFFVGLTGDIFFFYELSLLFALSLGLIIVKNNNENQVMLDK